MTSVSCENHTASISWSAVLGAVTYKATLEQINGGTSCCTTSDTGCDISDLPCGEMYILLISAEGRTCNSSQSEGEIVRTGAVHTVEVKHMHTLFRKCRKLLGTGKKTNSYVVQD